MKPNKTLVAVTYSIRQVYLSFKIRIRQWGYLPANRGSAVLITNHQHMDEGETITARTFFRHPWKPLVMCNSRRTFETGFIAARLPWTAKFTRGVNLSWLWESYSVLPVENHLFSRPLISIAEELRARHGDLPLEDVLPTDVLTEIGLAGCSISDLWNLEHFMQAQAWVKISSLKKPYRREVVEHLRATIDNDIAAIVDAVKDGATFYVTPEGDFSRDGRLKPMRGSIVEALAPIAALYLCAIAYDPFRGKRLSMLYRVVPLNGSDVGTSLAASRPVTTSALLSTFLLNGSGAFTIDDAVRSTRRQLDALPTNVFVDPELRSSPDTAIADAVANLCKRGTLTADGERYRLTEQRIDPRFPHVSDMVTFQKNMLEETLTSAAQLPPTP